MPRARFAATLVLIASASIQAVHAAPTFRWVNPTPQGNPLWAAAFESATDGLAVGDAGAVLRTTDGGVHWESLWAPGTFATSLYDVLSLGSGNYLAVGDAPGIFRSTDAGGTWTTVTNPSSGHLRKVDRLASGAISAIGQSGAVLRSTDGGASWSMSTTGGFQTLTGQHWANDLDGWAVGFHEPWRTTDGGVSWSPVQPLLNQGVSGDYTEVAFESASRGFVFAHFAIWETTDGGITWIEHGFDPSQPVYLDEALILGPTRRLVSIFLEGAGVFETTDDGATWNAGYDVPTVRGSSSLRAVPGGGFFSTTSGADLYRSADGTSWINATATPRTSGERQSIEAIEIRSDGVAFAGANRGFLGDTFLIRSTDGGQSWHEPSAAPSITRYAEIEFFDESYGLAAGTASPESQVARTTDGGASWSLHPLPESMIGEMRVSALEIPSATRAFALASADNANFLYRSTDQGTTWTSITNTLSSGLRYNGMSFLSETEGWIAGGEFHLLRLLHTTDGGVTWVNEPGSGLPSRELDDVYWFSQDSGLVASNSSPGGIYRTLDGGSTWSPVSGTATGHLSFAGMRGVGGNHFADEFQTSTDGGATWTAVPLPTTRILSSVHATANGFLVGGGANSILEMIDDAATSAPPVAVAAGGDLLRPTGSPGRAIGIEFQLESPGYARLEILDVTGRRVATLAEGSFPGRTEVRRQWDAGAAGVCFARLVTERGARSAKVVRLR